MTCLYRYMITEAGLQKLLAKAVKEHGSFNKAANALGINPTALHHAVHKGKIQPSVASAIGYNRVHMYEKVKG